MKSSVGFSSLALAAAAAMGSLGLAATSASAAEISWGTTQIMSGPGDIATNGTSVWAVRPATQALPAGDSATFGDTTFNVWTTSDWSNGVTTGSDGYFTIDQNAAGSFVQSNYSGGTFPTASPSTQSYSDLMSYSAIDNGNAPQATITLGGSNLSLIVGDTYQVEVWEYSPNVAYGFNNTLSGNPSGSLYSGNTNDINGVLGTYVIGTFTADATTQTFTDTNNDGSWTVLSAIALRNITPVPEPATLGLMALAGAGLLLIGRKRKSA